VYPKSSPLEKWIGAGALLLFIALAGDIGLDPQTTHHPILRNLASCCLIGGFLLFHGALYKLWDRKWKPIRWVKRSPDGVLWLRILAVILWLALLPFAILRAYDYIHQLRNHL